MAFVRGQAVQRAAQGHSSRFARRPCRGSDGTVPRIEACSRRFPSEPDSNALELEILERWEREGTFEQLREQNRGGPKWSFIDGPVTANKSLAVHTAWGRTLKDVFQRYKALRGFDQRYQNGFDCQGLWIEVGVERSARASTRSARSRSSGSRSSPRRCREVVVKSSEELTRGSKRLGQWMDWGNDYFTFSDTNIEYIWRFLKIVHERGWLYVGHRSTEWCPRCGTSLSQHELTQSGVYQEQVRPVALRPLPAARPCRASRSSSGRRRRGRCRRTSPPPSIPRPSTGCARTASGSPSRATRTRASCGACPARSSSACATAGRSTTSRPARRVEHRVVPWDEVSLEEGTGHRPHRDRLRRRGLRARPRARPAGADAGRRGRPLLRRLRLAARPLDHRGGRPDRRRPRRERLPRRGGDVRAPLPALLALRHAAHLPHLRRLVHRRRRRPRAAARGERDGRVGARLHGQAHGRLAAQHGRLEHLAPPLLRAAAAVLPLRLRAPERDRVEATSCASGRSRASTSSQELRRPWIDRVPIRCEACGEPVERVVEVGDVWLDAGIVPFSTLGWKNPEWKPGGYGTGAAKGLTNAPTCPTTPTGSSGSRPTGSRRCASRSGSGSTRSSSCRSCSSAARRSSGCSATRRCSTSTAARCTARGGT